MDIQGYVYILTNQPYGALYVGVTTDLVRRVCEHHQGVFGGSFTRRYGIKTLVWYENHADIADAMTRERQLKKWRRSWKIRLINGENPDWRDLFYDVCSS